MWISESTLDSEAEGFRDFKDLLYYDCRWSYVQTDLPVYISQINTLVGLQGYRQKSLFSHSEFQNSL